MYTTENAKYSRKKADFLQFSLNIFKNLFVLIPKHISMGYQMVNLCVANKTIFFYSIKGKHYKKKLKKLKTLSTQLLKCKSETCWLGISIMCQIELTCLISP